MGHSFRKQTSINPSTVCNARKTESPTTALCQHVVMLDEGSLQAFISSAVPGGSAESSSGTACCQLFLHRARLCCLFVLHI
ncbi:hypothetical protein QQF64_032823 [Cirrhinus molitorella]|uniref:Uncharacterized protein n=1 Tax=Cirrhinus molitorella TaxID=172907 RepID=A0ABR3MSA4_9TELE